MPTGFHSDFSFFAFLISHGWGAFFALALAVACAFAFAELHDRL